MRVLLIEDDVRLGEQLKPEMEREGHEVEWALDQAKRVNDQVLKVLREALFLPQSFLLTHIALADLIDRRLDDLLGGFRVRKVLESSHGLAVKQSRCGCDVEPLVRV